MNDKTQGLVRTFVAVTPPEKVLDQMVAWIRRLIPLAPYKWLSRGQLHLTLRFLGETPRSQIDALGDALAKMDTGGGFDICLNRAGGFPNLARPRAIWLGGDAGAQELSALAAKVESVAVDAGFPRETKRFTAHLTLARVKYEGSIPAALADALPAVPTFAWRCERFVFFKSDLTPTGPIYSVLREYSL